MAHYEFITMNNRTSWYSRIHLYSVQDVIAFHFGEPQPMHMIFNIDLDSDNVVFT